ncbi:Haloacid dehalogenase, type II [Penicillium digitatum]|uniref:Haloacid dehalogenase, type II n=1 Tax=Penicillium digitatum TaxID=36651 RepID=A0A7T6XIR2_PENDI|nr:Haloacid dehalogenase, type II [Penicillium digitatum]
MTNLSDYRLLCFDIYGTPIDWGSGIISALAPILSKSTTQFTRDSSNNLRPQKRPTNRNPDFPYLDYQQFTPLLPRD